VGGEGTGTVVEGLYLFGDFYAHSCIRVMDVSVRKGSVLG